MTCPPATSMWLSTREAARQLKLGERRVMQLARTRQLTGLKDRRGRWMVDPEAVARYGRVLDLKPSRATQLSETSARSTNFQTPLDRLCAAVEDLAAALRSR